MRTSVNGSSTRWSSKTTHIPELDDIAIRHFRSTQAPGLAISGRYLPLVYKIVSTLVSAPHHFTLLLIDLEGRFDATRLSCQEADARHVYVHRPSQPATGGVGIDELGETVDGASSSASGESLRLLISEAKEFMLYGDGAAVSSSRQLWGSVVIGGYGAGDLAAGWKGWLRVSREQAQVVSPGSSAEEALKRRLTRQEAVDAAGWTAESQWGGFTFLEGI